MQAWLCESLTGVEALQWRELPTPEPQAGEVRIAIRAASLNFPDLLTCRASTSSSRRLPFVPGSEFAGTVEAVGDGVTHLKPGDAVAALGSSGGFATHACVEASRVLPLPPGFPLEHGAAFAFAYGTSYHALLDRAALRAGETVLVLGAAGGVGSAAVQIAKAAGAKVIAAASSDEKCSLVPRLGADATVNYSTREPARRAQGTDRRQGPRHRLRPGRRRPRRTGVPLHRLARPLPGDRLRAGRHPGAALQPAAAQGGVHRRRLLGRVRATRAKGFARDWRSWCAGMPRAASSRCIDRRLPMRELPAAYARMAERGSDGQAAACERMNQTHPLQPPSFSIAAARSGAWPSRC
jgi:NADPH:quinone reductase